MLHELIWRTPAGQSPQSILAAVADGRLLTVEPEVRLKRTYFDSFDWRLFKGGRLLFLEDGQWRLYDRGDNRLIASLAADMKSYRFTGDFPVSTLRDELTKHLSMRALMSLGVLDLLVHRFRLLNADVKTVCHGELMFQEQKSADSAAALRLARLWPVRGYQEEFVHAAAFFDQLGSRESGWGEGCLLAALAGGNRQPLDYSAKFQARLDPENTGWQAAAVIFKALLATMRRNEQGIFHDIDSEFLHDFRVALRRTRSAIGLLRNVLGPETVSRYGEAFRELGQITGPVRDLDVYLLNETQYRAALPERLQTGLDYFFTGLTKRRHEEQQRLVRALHGKKYTQVMAGWQSYLEEGISSQPGREAGQPIVVLARRIIFKRYRRILLDGMAICNDTPDDKLHRLRIQGKKLRYSLEIFHSLFPVDAMARLISQLKELQDNLGTYNDLAVHQRMLCSYLSEIKPSSIRSRELAAAVGGLLGTMRQEQLRVRARFDEIFTRFAGPENRMLYNQLFRQKISPSSPSGPGE